MRERNIQKLQKHKGKKRRGTSPSNPTGQKYNHEGRMIVIEQRKHKSKEREKHIAIMIVAGPVFVTRRYET